MRRNSQASFGLGRRRTRLGRRRLGLGARRGHLAGRWRRLHGRRRLGGRRRPGGGRGVVAQRRRVAPLGGRQQGPRAQDCRKVGTLHVDESKDSEKRRGSGPEPLGQDAAAGAPPADRHFRETSAGRLHSQSSSRNGSVTQSSSRLSVSGPGVATNWS